MIWRNPLNLVQKLPMVGGRFVYQISTANMILILSL